MARSFSLQRDLQRNGTRLRPDASHFLPGLLRVDLRTREVVIDLRPADDGWSVPNGDGHTQRRAEAGRTTAPSVSLGAHAGGYAAKRLLETILVLATAVVWLPFLGALIVLVKCTSRGPAFYVQERVGRDGRTIRCRKLRTMVIDAERQLETLLATDPALRREFAAAFKLRHDPRITRVGRVLRVTGLDELPQLFSVISGTMSLVGPRPVTRDEASFYGPYLPVVQSVRPGLTGLWQVSGRNDIPYPMRVAYDVQYALTHTILSDLSILLRTSLVVFRPSRRGAY